MADFRAITAVCEGVVYLLRSQYDPGDFEQELEFGVYAARDFDQPMEAGVSLFLYRVYLNGAFRAPAGRLTPEGQRQRPRLPVDLHFLLTAWGREASLQHAITGWMMRVLEDTSILPAGLLNTRFAGVFGPSETVEVALADLPTEDLLHIWELLGHDVYHLSVPYVARNVHIESRQVLVEGGAVQERQFDYRQVIGEEG
jgi:hypothetical protein